MIRTKKILLLMVVVCLSVILIGCSPQAEEEPEEEGPEEAEPEEAIEVTEADEDEENDEDEEDKVLKDEDKAEENKNNGLGSDSTFEHDVDIKTDGEIKEGEGDEWWKEEGNNGDEWWKND